MRITRIEVEGDAQGHFATLSRKRGSDVIDVEILCPDLSRTHELAARDHDAQWSMAQRLQVTLDGYRGCGCDISEYFDVLTRLAD